MMPKRFTPCVGVIWVKIYILSDAIAAACSKWLKVGFRKVQRVNIILVPKKNQNTL